MKFAVKPDSAIKNKYVQTHLMAQTGRAVRLQRVKQTLKERQLRLELPRTPCTYIQNLTLSQNLDCSAPSGKLSQHSGAWTCDSCRSRSNSDEQLTQQC